MITTDRKQMDLVHSIHNLHSQSARLSLSLSLSLTEKRYIYIYIKTYLLYIIVKLRSDTRLLNKRLNNELLLKTWLFELQHFTSIDAWLPYTDTSALQTWHLLTKYTCTHLTSRHLHTLALDSISLYTLATYGTHFTFSYNFTHLSLGALWHTLHTRHTHLITSIYT